MKIYTTPSICSICGQHGYCRPKDAYHMYFNNLVCSDPDVCSRNLERKAGRLAEKEKELKALESKLLQINQSNTVQP